MNKIEKRCQHCGQSFTVWPHRKKKAKYCGFKCYWNHLKGTDSLALYRRHGPLSKTTRRKMSEARTKTLEGQTIALSSGYVVRRLRSHPNSDIHNFYGEHRYVMEKAIGRILKKSEVVHHINHKKDDNRIENLILFKSARGHQMIHKGSAVPKEEIIFMLASGSKEVSLAI